MKQLLPAGSHLPTLLALCCAVLAFGIAAPGTSHAQNNQEQARELFQEGRSHFEDGEYGEAAELFVEAYDLLDAPELLYNIGQAYRRAGNLVEAERYFQEYLNQMSDPPNEDEVVDTIVEIQQELSAQQPIVSVTTEPAQADVFVDDEEEARCHSPCEVELAHGEHELRAEREAHHPATTTIAVEPGEEAEVELTLEPDIPVGNLVVETDVEEADLFVGGRQISLPHSDSIELEAGSTAMTVEADGERLDYEIDVEAGETRHLFVPVGAAAESMSLLHTSAIGLGTTALALGAAALLTGFNARTTYGDLERAQSDHGGVDPGLLAAGQRQQRLANGFWIGAAVTGVIGLGLWAWEFFQGRHRDPPPAGTSDEDSPGVDML